MKIHIKKYLMGLFVIFILFGIQNAMGNETLTLDITNPESIIYDNGDILLNITTNKNSDIDYELNNNSFIGCTNCTGYTEQLNLTEDTYSLTVTAVSGNENVSETVNFSVVFPQEFALVINKPESITYSTTTVPINISAGLASDISYVLDGGNETSLCVSCDSVTNELTNLAEGDHTLRVISTRNNVSIEDSVSFSVSLEEQEREEKIDIKIDLKGRLNSEQIGLIQSLISSVMDDIRNLKIEIKSKGHDDDDDDESDEKKSEIKVKVKGYITDDEREILDKLVESLDSEEKIKIKIHSKLKKPKFDEEFEKLPQEYEDGEISSEELIKILKNKNLPPGVINRLLKENILSGEEINAIIENQFLPTGIFQKILSMIDKGENKIVEDLFDNYDLTDEQMSDLLLQNEVPKGTIKHLIKSKQLGSKTIDVIIDQYNLSEKQLKELIKKQSLSDDNIEKLLEKDISEKVRKELVKYQISGREHLNKISEELEKDNKEEKETKGKKEKDIKKKSKEEKVLKVGKQSDHKKDKIDDHDDDKDKDEDDDDDDE